MTVDVGPNIETNDLTLFLDAANNKSYDSRENLVSYSTYNASTWSNIFTANATLTTGISAPDGTSTAIRLTCSATGSSLLRVSFPAFTPNGTDTYTISFYVRRISGTTSSGSALLTDFSDGNPSGNYLPNLITGEWVRVSFTAVPTATAKSFIDLLSNNTNNYVLDFWGVQVEKSTTPSTYTPTTGSTITRSTTWKTLTTTANSGTLLNGPTYNSLNNGSIVFDGVDDYVNLGVNSLLDNTLNGSTNWSISYWIKYTQDGRILDCGNVGVDPSGALELNTTSISANNIGSAYSLSAPLIPSDWNFITLTKDSSTLHSWYLNGVFSNSSITNNNYTVNSQAWKIGRRALNTTFIYGGNIAQLSIYSRALTAAEVLQNFNASRSRYGI